MSHARVQTHTACAREQTSRDFWGRQFKGYAVNYNPKIILAFWADCGLPTAQVEFKFHPARKWKFDFAFGVVGARSEELGDRMPGFDSDANTKLLAARFSPLAIEVQGAIWTGGRHSRGSGLVKEYEKMNAAAVLGWRVMYCTPQEIGTLKFARTIQAALKIGQL
jgi:hypothetical protein